MAEEEKTLTIEEEEISGSDSGGPRWLKSYPPLITLVVALLIAVLVLPSALNLPQANPSTVLEYAPVPPDDDSPPPPSDGSISSLGLGTSGTLSRGAVPDRQQILGAGGAARGQKPTQKKCVGTPPRQTEDPNAPPCVAFFDGENGGNTWQGVFSDHVLALIYADTHCNTGGETGVECTPDAAQYCDVQSPSGTDPACLATDYASGEPREYDWMDVKIYRAYAKYFNDRFQTYGRTILFYVYWANADTPAERRSDASGNWKTMKEQLGDAPFAVLQRPAFGGFDDVYTEGMAKRRVMSFGALTPRPNAYYKAYSPPVTQGGMIWNFWPDVEHWADQYVGYLCNRVLKSTGGKVRGNPNYPPEVDGQSLVGQNRTYGFLYTTDDRFPQFHYMSELVHEGAEQCGIKFGNNIYRFSRHQYSIDTHPDAPVEANDNVSLMKDRGVTTLIMGPGYDVEHSKAMSRFRYFPEIVVLGDGWHDEISKARYQDGDASGSTSGRAWANAVLASNKLLEDKQENSPCRQAYRAVDPRGIFPDRACLIYPDFFMIFKAIQVAGPILGPDTVDQGQHAIPPQESTSPYVAACFFDPGDFTCVKDMREGWWDKDAPDPDGDVNELGCYRLTDGGKRRLANGWDTSYKVYQNPSDVCDNQGADADINPYGPTG